MYSWLPPTISISFRILASLQSLIAFWLHVTEIAKDYYIHRRGGGPSIAMVFHFRGGLRSVPWLNSWSLCHIKYFVLTLHRSMEGNSSSLRSSWIWFCYHKNVLWYVLCDATWGLFQEIRITWEPWRTWLVSIRYNCNSVIPIPYHRCMVWFSLNNGNAYTGKTSFLYWNGPLVLYIINHGLPC